MESAISALKAGAVLDALEARVCAVEDAGFSSVGPSGIPDKKGVHALDAGLMTGANRLSASVGALVGYKNPFRVVRKLYELQKENKFPHNFLVGDGAGEFAERQEAERVFPHVERGAEPRGVAHDTVGCVAFDGKQWAVGTSTSGWGGKEPGRIGDTPVPGGGFYANAHGAAFCTWTGEIAVRLNLAGRALAALEMGKPIEEAVRFSLAALDEMKDGYKGPLILHLATDVGVCVVGAGFEDDVIPSTFSFWRAGMNSPKRFPVPAWNPELPVPVFASINV
jgi:L-asparaginase